MIQGIDVSEHNGHFDWDKAKRVGVRFAIIRAAFGYRDDKEFIRNWAEAKRVGIPRGVYGWPLHGLNQEVIAQRFVDKWKNDPGELPPFADYEWTEYHGSATFDELKRFISTGEKLSGISMAIYTSQGFWDGQPGNQAQNWILDHDLWVANYTLNAKPAMPSIWKAAGVSWVLWQHTAKGKASDFGGEGRDIDLNYFNGGEAEFKNYVKGEVIPPPLPKNVVVISDKLSFRSRAEIYKGDRPYIEKGTSCKVLKKVTTDITWYYVELSGGDKGYISAGTDFVRAI